MKPTLTQRGSTLIVALIVLTLMTLVAVASLNMSSTSIQVVGNMQLQEEAAAAAQQAIDNIITQTAYTAQKFNEATPDPQEISMSGEDGETDYVVTFNPPNCVSYLPVNPLVDDLPVECYASGGSMLCYWGVWEITAVAEDKRTGAKATVHQGVSVLTGQTAALAGCGV